MVNAYGSKTLAGYFALTLTAEDGTVKEERLYNFKGERATVFFDENNNIVGWEGDPDPYEHYYGGLNE